VAECSTGRNTAPESSIGRFDRNLRAAEFSTPSGMAAAPMIGNRNGRSTAVATVDLSSPESSPCSDTDVNHLTLEIHSHFYSNRCAHRRRGHSNYAMYYSTNSSSNVHK
jgi:hypothetical protein